MNINLLSAGGFIFFLLIVLIGYIFVEVLYGEKYHFRYTFEKYENKFLDRLFHYIFWGIILNISLFYLYSYADGLESIANMYNTSVKFAEALRPIIGGDESIKFIILSISYFLGVGGLMLMFKIITKFLDGLVFIIELIKKNCS